MHYCYSMLINTIIVYYVFICIGYLYVVIVVNFIVLVYCLFIIEYGVVVCIMQYIIMSVSIDVYINISMLMSVCLCQHIWINYKYHHY